MKPYGDYAQLFKSSCLIRELCQDSGAVCQGAIAMKKQRVVRGVVVEEGSGNVYADLDYADSESMLVKAELAAKIAEIIQRRTLTQADAARILGLTQPKISALLKGRFRGISEHRLLECLTRLGRDVHIVIKPAPRSRTNGRLILSVV
jgi:predicted XRE-type DNA-binding protein